MRFASVSTGLWRSADFRKLWTSLTITSFGAQITNLALPLTAARAAARDAAGRWACWSRSRRCRSRSSSLHAGVLIDRVRKLPIVIAADIGRGVALLAIPIAAFTDVLSIEILFAVGFFCGVQNVVGGAAYQVLLAQMAGRKRLVEANAKIALGETSSALVGPGLAGGLIQLADRAVRDPARRVRVPRVRAAAAPRARAERRAARRPAAVGGRGDRTRG